EDGIRSFHVTGVQTCALPISMRGFLHRTERNKTNLVRLAHFFKRPANAHVTRQSLAAIGRPFKGGNSWGHWKGHGDFSVAGCLVECRIPNFTAHLLDVRDRPESTSLNYFFC